MYLSVCLSALFFIKMLSGCLGSRRFRSLLYSLKPSLSLTYFGLDCVRNGSECSS